MPQVLTLIFFAINIFWRKWNESDQFVRNRHPATAKLKRAGFWAVETRIDDAVDDDRTMLRLAKRHQRILTEALCE